MNADQHIFQGNVPPRSIQKQGRAGESYFWDALRELKADEDCDDATWLKAAKVAAARMSEAGFSIRRVLSRVGG